MRTRPGAHVLATSLLLLLCADAYAQPTPPPFPSDAPVAPGPRMPPAGPAAPGLQSQAPAPAYRPLSPQELALLHRKRRRHLGLLGAGTVLALGGATFGLISRKQESSARSAPNQVEARKTLSTAHRNGVIANVGFAGAGMAVVGALVAYLVRPPLPAPPQGAEGAR